MIQVLVNDQSDCSEAKHVYSLMYVYVLCIYLFCEDFQEQPSQSSKMAASQGTLQEKGEIEAVQEVNE